MQKKHFHTFLKNRITSRLEAGDTIIEVLIALAVISLVLGSSAALASHSTRSLQDTQEHSDAQRLAQTQLEILRSYAVKYGDDFRNPAQAVYTGGTGFCMNPSLGPVPTTAGVPAGSCKLNSKGEIYNSARDPFYYTIYGSSSPDAGGGFNINFKVSWNSLLGPDSDLNLKYRLYRQVPIAEKVTIKPQACSTPAYVAIAIDHSPSMKNPYPRTGGPNRLVAAKSAATQLIFTLRLRAGGNNASIAQYSGVPPGPPVNQVMPGAGMSPNSAGMYNGINNINFVGFRGGGTTLTYGIRIAWQQINFVKSSGLAPPGSKYVMVILSDGYQNPPGRDRGNTDFNDASAVAEEGPARTAGDVDIYPVALFQQGDPETPDATSYAKGLAFFNTLKAGLNGRVLNPANQADLVRAYEIIGQKYACDP